MTNYNLEMLDRCSGSANRIFDDLRQAFEAGTLDEWIEEEALDIEYTLDGQRNFIGATIYVTLGGPTAWIDTRRQEIVCCWGGQRSTVWLGDVLAGEINERFYDLF